MPTKKPTSTARSNRASKSPRKRAVRAPSNVISLVEHLEAKGLTDSVTCRRIRMMGWLAEDTGLDAVRAEFDLTVGVNMPVIFAA